jgi:hypothetical protein
MPIDNLKSTHNTFESLKSNSAGIYEIVMNRVPFEYKAKEYFGSLV